MDLVLVYIILLVISFIVCVVRYSKLPANVKPIVWILALAVLFEIPGYYMHKRNINHYYLFHVYNTFEAIILGIIYNSSFKVQRVRKITYWSIVIFAVSAIFNSLFIQKFYLNVSDSNNIIWGYLLRVVWILYYFYELYSDDSVEVLSSIPVFWISIGNFLFFAGALIVTAIKYKLKQTDPALASSLYPINSILNCIMYICYIVGFYANNYGRSR